MSWVWLLCLGAKLVGETAEAKRIDRSQGDSTMMVVAQQMQDMIDNCLRFHAEYMQESNAGSSLVNRDFMGTVLSRRRFKRCCSFTPLARLHRKRCCCS